MSGNDASDQAFADGVSPSGRGAIFPNISSYRGPRDAWYTVADLEAPDQREQGGHGLCAATQFLHAHTAACYVSYQGKRVVRIMETHNGLTGLIVESASARHIETGTHLSFRDSTTTNVGSPMFES